MLQFIFLHLEVDVRKYAKCEKNQLLHGCEWVRS
jgi:hypothetical protein